ncbi:uncharacterized protein LOC133896013 [Phragmites australis]|uniref:uncharacterized protein LOC133896013 n=1 Tax=Phragmites australis TaxID=29695 RepID=UPI002D795F08|nr:uncharacterized protein LOC133896013 [Phragmites australis]
MTAERACSVVCGTRHMRELCLRTLPPRGGVGAAVPVTRHAMVAVRTALDSYTATAATTASLIDGGAIPASDKAAYGDCMVGYGRARGAMARVADDLAGGCDRAADLKPGYTVGLRGMDRCRRSMFNYPASPLYAMNLADRNRTLLAALLCSLVPAPRVVTSQSTFDSTTKIGLTSMFVIYTNLGETLDDVALDKKLFDTVLDRFLSVIAGIE